MTEIEISSNGDHTVMFKWLCIMLIGVVALLTIGRFSPSQTEKAKQQTLKIELELKDKELEILKLKEKGETNDR